MMNANEINISLIIVTYNAAGFIADCLQSVGLQSCTKFETIIVDNNSSDNTVSIIETEFPWAKVYRSNDNLGFTGGVLLGYKYAIGEYIALLNPDTRANRFWLENLLKAIESNDKIGSCASLLLRWGTDIVDTAGDGCTRAGKGFKYGDGEKAELYNQERYVFGACGGAVLYRRKMLNEIGFFDNDFFLLHEDTDISFRAQLAGWDCLYVPTAIVEHKVSASIGHKNAFAVYYSVRNSDRVWLKNMPLLLIILTLPEKLLSDICSFIYLGILYKQWRTIIKAKTNVFTSIPALIRQRIEIQRHRRVTIRHLLSILIPFFSKSYLCKNILPKLKLKSSSFGGGETD